MARHRVDPDREVDAFWQLPTDLERLEHSEGAREVKIDRGNLKRSERAVIRAYNTNMRSTNLLGKIEEQAIDGDISKALRLCLSLGGKTGSTDLRGWASLELNGYRGQDVPEYRRIVAPLQVDGMTMSHHVQRPNDFDLRLAGFRRGHHL